MSELKEWVSHPVEKLKEAYKRQQLLREFDAAGPDSARVAHSLGMTSGELRRLIADGSQDLPVNDLLVQLGLDPRERSPNFVDCRWRRKTDRLTGLQHGARLTQFLTGQEGFHARAVERQHRLGKHPHRRIDAKQFFFWDERQKLQKNSVC